MTAIQQFWIVPNDVYLVSTPYPVLAGVDTLEAPRPALVLGAAVPIEDDLMTSRAAFLYAAAVLSVKTATAADEFVVAASRQALISATAVGNPIVVQADEAIVTANRSALTSADAIPIPVIAGPWDTADYLGASRAALISGVTV